MVCGRILLLLAASVSVASAAYCNGKPSPDAQLNLNPIYTEAPVFVRSVPNGKLYTVGEADDTNNIVHLWGTPYEKGYAHGSLMKNEAQNFVNKTYGYFEEQVEQAINGTATKLHIPQWVVDAVSEIGLDALLDLTYDVTSPFTGKYFYEEMKGLADGASVDYDTIRRIHMIGELTKGGCSMYGAWGSATASLDGRLLQLRALDWDVDGPFKNFPQVTVYHNDGSPDQGYSFANIGWTGWIGSITGLSEQKIGISEIGVSYPDASFGKESRIGIPFTNILRDIIQFDNSLDAAVHRISTANRTCDLILGVGDGKPAGATGSFRGVEYSYSVANFFTDKNMMPDNSTWHPRLEDVVYYGMDWLCPSFNSVLSRQLTTYHGKITPAVTVKDILPIVQTGDLHAAIYDLSQLQLYLATARSDGESGPPMAYDRVFNQIDMNVVFAEKPPQ